MILGFAETAEYWLEQSRIAKQEKRMKDALLCAYRAMRIDDAFAYRLAYAETLLDMNQYKMAAAVCLRYTGKFRDEEYMDYCTLMCDAAARMGDMSAYVHYQMEIMRESEFFDEEGFDEVVNDFMKHFEEREQKKNFAFVDDLRKRKHRAWYDELYDAYIRGNYRRALELVEDLDGENEFYVEALFIWGMSLAKTGDVEEGKRKLWEMYGLTKHDSRVLYYLDEMGDGLTDEEMQKGLSALTPDGNKDNMAMASICAYMHALHKTALYYAQAAYDIEPYDVESGLRLAAAYYNLGDRENGDRYYREVLETYAGFFPRVLADVRLEAPVDLNFDYAPAETYDAVARYVRKLQEGEYMAVLMQTDLDFRECVRFLLTAPNADQVALAKLAGETCEWLTPEGIRFERDLLIDPATGRTVRFRLLLNLLDKVRKGTVNVTVDWVCETFKLKVPPSFEDFSPDMRRVYGYAYLEMVGQNAHRELKLSKVMEKLYLNLPAENYQADVMGLAVVVGAKIADLGPLLTEKVLDSGWDIDLFMGYVDLVKQTLKNA